MCSVFADTDSRFLALVLDGISGSIRGELVLELDRFFLRRAQLSEQLVPFGLFSAGTQVGKLGMRR